MLKLIAFVVFMIVLMPLHGFAQDKICEASNRECIFSALIRTTGSIENPIWRDQSYREIAKSLAADGRFDDAFDVWEKIENPDTKALTIRGIGMAVADFELPKDQYDALFKALRARSETITHPPSYAIALTYIAMAQAFAKDDEGAWATAASMENEALRYKAYGESAEIQAERGDLGAAVRQSLSRLEGTYGIAVIHVKHPDVLIAARKGSPVVIGLKENEHFVASDVTPLVSHTKDVIYLEDGEIAEITPSSYHISTLSSTLPRAV